MQNENQEISQKRDYQVVKSNALVLRTRYEFSVAEQKTLAYVCSMIKPASNKDEAENQFVPSPYILEYEFEILDYIKILGIEKTGEAYNDIKNVLKGLKDKSIWITLDDGSETTAGWLSKVWTNKKSGTARIRFDEDLIPYLFDLREKYLSYGLRNILLMKSQYGIRLYEMIKAYHDLNIGRLDKRNKELRSEYPMALTWKMDLDELKIMLNAASIKSYQNFNLFKTKALEKAIDEINALTDMQVSYEPIKKGRKVIAIEFTISQKNYETRFTINENNEAILNGLGKI